MERHTDDQERALESAPATDGIELMPPIPPTSARRGGRLAQADCYPAGEERVAAHFVRLPTGERVRVLSSGDRAAPPVVLVHGWACSAYSWRYQLPVLAEAGFRAIAMDLRGHGFSDRPTADSDYSTSAMTDFLTLVLDTLQLEQVAMVGHSLGAAIAARTALRSPGRVSRLATLSGIGFGRAPMVAALSRIPDAVVTPLLPLATSRALFRLVLRLVSGGPGRFTARDVDEYWAPTQFPEFIPTLWRLLRVHGWAQLDDYERARLTLPILAMYGGRDRLVREPDSGSAAGAAWPAAHTLIGVGHAGHEEAPELVNALLLPFLAPWWMEFDAGRASAAGG